MSKFVPLDTLVRDFLKQDETGALQAYVRATASTCGRWKKGECGPSGYWRVRAMHFLNKQGFPSAELMSLPEQVRLLGELISDNKVSIDEAVSATATRTSHNLVSMLLGRRTCTIERLSKIDELARSKKEVQEGDRRERDEVIKGAAALIRTLQPLVMRLVSTEFTPEDRADVRSRVGAMDFFHLSNALDTLCGGKAVMQCSQSKPKNQTEEK